MPLHLLNKITQIHLRGLYCWDCCQADRCQGYWDGFHLGQGGTVGLPWPHHKPTEAWGWRERVTSAVASQCRGRLLVSKAKLQILDEAGWEGTALHPLLDLSPSNHNWGFIFSKSLLTTPSQSGSSVFPLRTHGHRVSPLTLVFPLLARLWAPWGLVSNTPSNTVPGLQGALRMARKEWVTRAPAPR